MSSVSTVQYQSGCNVNRSRYTRLPNCLNDLLFGEYIEDWLMTQQERMAVISLLERIKPECAIEVGTLHGGSLSAIAKFSKKVYTLDCDPDSKEKLADKFPNVEFVTGYSNDTLPPLLEKLQKEGTPIEFVLIDASHTTEGVKQDIENLIKYVPQKPLCIVIHDSFMPECRQGMIQANWASSPYVHFVEIDFIPGRFNSDPAERSYRKMTCGLAVAMMLPVKREGELSFLIDGGLQFEILKKNSIHRKSAIRKILGRVKRKIKNLM